MVEGYKKAIEGSPARRTPHTLEQNGAPSTLAPDHLAGSEGVLGGLRSRAAPHGAKGVNVTQGPRLSTRRTRSKRVYHASEATTRR